MLAIELSKAKESILKKEKELDRVTLASAEYSRQAEAKEVEIKKIKIEKEHAEDEVEAWRQKHKAAEDASYRMEKVA